jgi:ABC-2 type transport system ATP-binding protein
VPRAKRAERRDWVLEMAGLAEHRRRLTMELPLGWKQRLALGCAVLHEPAVLFLDEPTSGVDPIARRQFWDLIYRLSGQGTTVFVSTHYMEEAEYCHRLALMNRGQLIALDTPRALRRDMREPILEIRLDDAPNAVEVVRGAPGVIEAAMYGRAMHATVTDSGAVGPGARGHPAEAGSSVDTIRDVPPSLEDVFVSRVRAAGGAPTSEESMMIRTSRLLAISRKEILQLRRDTRSLALAFVLPSCWWSSSPTASAGT